MIVPCSVCGEDVEVSTKEFLDNNEWFCDDCAAAILEYFYEFKLRKN